MNNITDENEHEPYQPDEEGVNAAMKMDTKEIYIKQLSVKLDETITKNIKIKQTIENLKRAMRIHAGDICSINCELERALDNNEKLEKENDKLRAENKGLKKILEKTALAFLENNRSLTANQVNCWQEIEQVLKDPTSTP